MKFNDLTIKDQVLVAIEDINASRDRYGVSIDDIRSYLGEDCETYLTNRQISSALCSLHKNGLVNRNGSVYSLNNAGKVAYEIILSKIDEYCNDDEQPSDFQSNGNASNWTEIAQQFAEVAKHFAGAATAKTYGSSNDEELKKKIQSLEIENTALEERVKILRSRLSAVYAELDEKNKKIEHLENSFDKINVNLSKMANWAADMKNGAN